ncbi:MAG: BREX-3 system phosphatase PglZ [Balneolales bacterium]|nr:BREX-3 system phosphatase PglZ [Balneolales bacterium]
MAGWRDQILQEFIPQLTKLTLVADPDGLLTEEKLAGSLRKNGFDIIEFSDPIEFRYLYETRYRSVWDKGEKTDLVVSLRFQHAELETLPYDLLCAGRKLSFSLGNLFPNLSYPVLELLDASLLDSLYDAHQTYKPERLGDNATKDFVLRHVFGIAPELVSNQTELLRILLRVHHGKLQIPAELCKRLVTLLDAKKVFSEWPLMQLLTDTNTFLIFLQERWALYLKELAGYTKADDFGRLYAMSIDGPVALPFAHEDVRVYLEKFFVEGRLKPVEIDAGNYTPENWMLAGLVSAEQTGHSELRIQNLFEEVSRLLPDTESRHSDWLNFAMVWAELSALVHQSGHKGHKDKLRKHSHSINEVFWEWLQLRYSSLIHLPPVNPSLVNHIPRKIAREMEQHTSGTGAGAVLIVVDGLALDQWITLREELLRQESTLIIRESAVFAWIPTITSVSRQAIFAGKTPYFFSGTITTTNAESRLWEQFWEGNGISRQRIKYKRGLGNGNATVLHDFLKPAGKPIVAGLVIDKVDKIMHGMQLGAAGMHNQIKQWAEGGYLAGLIMNLLESGFQVWMTSDHGNTECTGTGRPSEGAVADLRGERVRIYPTKELRQKVAQTITGAGEWQTSGLPDTYFPLLAPHQQAFVSSGESLVGHGGASLEEVIVPFVKFEHKVP